MAFEKKQVAWHWRDLGIDKEACDLSWGHGFAYGPQLQCRDNATHPPKAGLVAP